MRTRGTYHESRIPAILGGVVVAVALFAFVSPVRAGDTAEVRDRSSAPTVSGDSLAAPEQALHRGHGGTAVVAVRPAHPGGCLPVVVQLPTSHLCNRRPGDSAAVAPPASGQQLRILFCTWLN